MNNVTPITYVLFGATGDLAQKKIIPALFKLFQSGDLSPDSRIIAYSRRPWSDTEYRDFVHPLFKNVKDQKAVEQFLQRVSYASGTFDEQRGYENLKEKIISLGTKAQVIVHLAIQPEFYNLVIKRLGETGFHLLPQGIVTKIIIEKPFGHDTESAIQLEKEIEHYFTEDQIYRIDHYLGKPGLRAVLEMRVSDHQFESTLHAQDVKSIELKLFETIDIEGRGEFYEETGAIRDVGQNHLLEMVAVVAQAIPHDPSPETFQQARADAISSLKPIVFEHIPIELGTTVSRGQYEGYRAELAVSPDSDVETYFRIKTSFMSGLLKNVPVILEGGKALGEQKIEIVINYHNPQRPPKRFNLHQHSLPETLDAYQVLILEAIQNNKTWFVSMAEVTASWKLITPILVRQALIPLIYYKKGTTPIN